MIAHWRELPPATIGDLDVWQRAEKYIRVGFWGLNIGLALMVLLDLFPAGALQRWDVLVHGYWHARRSEYLLGGTFHTLEWVRAVGDTVFLLFGAAPITYATVRLVFARSRGSA